LDYTYHVVYGLGFTLIYGYLDGLHCIDCDKRKRNAKVRAALLLITLKLVPTKRKKQNNTVTSLFFSTLKQSEWNWNYKHYISLRLFQLSFNPFFFHRKKKLKNSNEFYDKALLLKIQLFISFQIIQAQESQINFRNGWACLGNPPNWPNWWKWFWTQ
jgi:hypothetical protein